MTTQGWKKTDEPGIYTDGTRFRVRVTAKTPGGSRGRKQQTLGPEATLADAREIRRNLREELKTPDDPEARTTTIGDYATQWMKRKAKRMKPSTTNRYRRALAGHILPQLGHLPLEDLERGNVIQWVHDAESATKESGDRYATATVRGWWRVLLQLLKDAHADGELPREVWRRVDAPDTGVRRRREQRTLTGEELAELVDTCREKYPQRYAEVATLGYTGVRAGELYALEWDDIDLARGRIVVSKSVWRGEHVTSTKTQDPRRVAAPDLVVEALEEHRERLMREQHPGLEQGLVFPADGGGYRLPQSIGKTLRSLEDDVETDVHLTPQVLRRTYNNLLRKAQVDRIVLREQMGHTDEPMTERYSSVDFEEKRDAVTRVFDQTRQEGGKNG